MKKWPQALGLSAVLLVATATAASADHYGGGGSGGGGGSNSTSTSTTVTPTTGGPTTTDAPRPTVVPGTVNNDTPRPGETITVSSGSVALTGPFSAVLVRGNGASDVPVTAVQGSNNTWTIQIPAGIQPGLYIVVILGSEGTEQRAVVVPIVVRPATSAAAASAGSPSLGTSSVALPSEVREIQTSVKDASAVEEAVLEDGATMAVEDMHLVVKRPGDDSDDTRPLVAAGAVALGGAGLVLLRRRTPTISRRTR